ncbi:MAG: hypothetical protein EP305_01995 [Bacteroidetes bacterium]|nr:MAG: hypothetical protein EP305_01995 [Bacteroidota bacterium]
MKRVALIACVKEKKDYSCAAIEMYEGFFPSWLQHSERLKAEKFYILSGKYGLLKPDEIIEPYDFNLNYASKEYLNEWNDKVLKRLNELENISECEFLIYTNLTYMKELIKVLPFYTIPLSID